MMSGVSKPTLQPSNTSFSSNFMSVPSQAPQTSSIPQVDTHIDEISSTAVKLPTPIASSSETFESTGLYLMDDGDKLWLYIGRYFNVNLLEELFGLPIHGREVGNNLYIYLSIYLCIIIVNYCYLSMFSSSN